MAINKRHVTLDIHIQSEPLEQVATTEDGNCASDIRRRIGKAQAKFGRLGKIWKDRTGTGHTKLRLYESSVLSVPVYSSECWVIRKDERRILTAEMGRLRLGCYWLVEV